ncbi:MAG TPA: C10 family peptidase [Flavobacteriales bacterium]|nr:C10 family peptidase [Flavobacteriales bacterium]
MRQIHTPFRTRTTRILAISLLLALSLLIPAALNAAQVGEASARAIALQYLAKRDAAFTDMREADVQLVLVRGEATDDPNGGVVFFRVFNVAGQGFVIVSGDDLVLPILGYSTEGGFPTGELRYDVADWLEAYAIQIQAAIAGGNQQASEVAMAWQQLQEDDADRDADAVQPLVQTKWDQSPYVNAQCPGGSVTGCVATAMAQVMKYHNHPAQGQGFHSYNANNYGTLSANFGATTYNWSAMPNIVNSANSAVATLMYHCGVGVEMNYSPQVSGAYVISSYTPIQHCAEYALRTYFGYDQGMQGKMRASFSESQWVNMLKAELDGSRPIVYAGVGSGGGHCFVLDGYDNNNKFHVNWGWGGQADGYFTISNLDPSSIGTGGGTGGFNSDQHAIFGLKPPPGSGGGGNPPSYNMALYTWVTPSATTIYYGQAFSVNTNIINNSTNTFNGDYCAAAFDANGNFVDYIQVLSNYNLPAGYVYNNNLVFSTDGLFSMLPGTYRIGIFYRATNGEWVLVGNNGSYTNLPQVSVINPNNIELNAALTVSPGLSVTQGAQLSVNTNILNDGWNTFIGQYGVGLYNLDGTWAQDIGVLTESQGLPSGYTYLSPYLTFGPATVTVPPGTYLLAVQHNPNNSGWQLTGSSYFNNPIFVTVTAAALQPDPYEANNTQGQAHSMPVNFSGNNANVATTEANIHNGNDRDFYKVVLPAGFSYTINARLHDSWNSGNGNTYSVDGLWSWSTNGSTWSTTYDDVMPGNITLNNGGTVWFQVAPYFPGNVGTYLLQMNIQRNTTVGIHGESASAGIAIHPNPARNQVTVAAGEALGRVKDLCVMDMQGRTVAARPLGPLVGGRVELDVSGLPEGTYVLRLFTDAGVLNERLIIAR